MEIPGSGVAPARMKPRGFLLACEGIGRDPHGPLPPAHGKPASLGRWLENAARFPQGPAPKARQQRRDICNCRHDDIYLPAS
jgi:hypothetical protein